MNEWPEAQMLELLHCYNVRHMSSGECGTYFHVTRNTIVGKIKRGRAKYGFERRGGNVEAKQRARFKKPPKIKPRPQVYNNKKCKLPDDKNKAIVILGPNGPMHSVINSRFVEPAWEETTADNRSIWQLESHNCVWPVSGQGADTVYCGANKTTQSYCVGHSKKAYRA